MSEQSNIEQGRVESLCRELRLPSVSENAARLATEAQRQGTSYLDFLIELLEAEVEDRRERRAQRRQKEARFPVVKTIEGFDFSRNPDLPEPLIRQLLEGDYIDKAEHVIFLGEPGTGKTHLATALGVAAARQGRRVRFVTAARLANELVEARDARELNRMIGRYSRTAVLVLDEVGYIPLSKTDAELLFQVLGERQERCSVVLTTNLPFSEWTSVFSDARLCRAMVDRLTHKAHIIETGERSIRLEDSKRRKKRPPKKGG
jgi:DNA replication protein DnaC